MPHSTLVAKICKKPVMSHLLRFTPLSLSLSLSIAHARPCRHYRPHALLQSHPPQPPSKAGPRVEEHRRRARVVLNRPTRWGAPLARAWQLGQPV